MVARRTVLRSVAVAAPAAVLAACSDESGPGERESDAAPVAKISASPADGDNDVGVTDTIELSVTEGELDEVTLTNDDGDEVAGELSDDKASWTTTEPLGYGKRYRYTAKATGSDDKPVEADGEFHTVNPDSTVQATFTPGDDAEVGVGMPIAVRFEKPIADREAAEKALSVTTEPEVEGSWAWLHDRQVDWRPKDYWPADTTVKVEAKLYGVHYGGGAYGKADVNTEFTIGRNQVVKINTPDHEMKVYRDDELVASYPCSNGKDDDPDLNTPNGTMIVMSKEPTAIFNNEEYGYTDLEKKWAVRFSNHGEFIHENEENRANIGKKNTSHGCVNLTESDAKKYYDTAMVGDPVEVTGATADMPTTSDVADWLYDWDTWTSMSALA